MIVDNAVYVRGRRIHNPENLDQTYELMRQNAGVAWIGLYRPDVSEISSVALEFGLHRLAVEDAVAAHQRPKLERYGDQLFVALRPARYIETTETVEFGEVHVFVGPDFVVTVRHAESPDLSRVRARLESNPTLLGLGPQSILYAILDEVVDQFLPVVEGLENDIDEIDDQLFSGDPDVSRRIYELSRTVINFQRSTAPMVTMLQRLSNGSEKYHVNEDLQHNLRDVLDHAIRISDRVDGYRANLADALTVHNTLIAQRQNEEMRAMTELSIQQNEQVKRISSWGAIFFAPSLVAGIYGMNFEHMPELAWPVGYPLALVLMVLSSTALYVIFRRQKWL